MSLTPSPRLRGPPTPRLGFSRSDSTRISIGRGRSRNSLRTPSPRPGAPPSPCPGPASPPAGRARPSRGGRARPLSANINSNIGAKKVTDCHASSCHICIPLSLLLITKPTSTLILCEREIDDTISEGCNRKHQSTAGGRAGSLFPGSWQLSWLRDRYWLLTLLWCHTNLRLAPAPARFIT